MLHQYKLESWVVSATELTNQKVPGANLASAKNSRGDLLGKLRTLSLLVLFVDWLFGFFLLTISLESRQEGYCLQNSFLLGFPSECVSEKSGESGTKAALTLFAQLQPSFRGAPWPVNLYQYCS